MKKISVFVNDTISSDIVKSICDDLLKDRLELLSFRKCRITDKEYKKVIRAVGTSHVLRHLCLNIDMVCDCYRVQVLAQALQRNSSLVGLHLHGNKITDTDIKTLYPHIKMHPRVISLDLGDCHMGDEGMEMICKLIMDTKHTHGLHELVLSHNPKVTSDGWTQFGMALASGSRLRSLEIDYNNIGDSVASCIATALPGATYLETLNLECTGITDKTGQVLLILVMFYNMKLKTINLDRTQVLQSTKDAILLHTSEQHTEKANGHISDDACSLAISEPPLLEHDRDIDLGNITRAESLDVSGIPIVEVSPVSKEAGHATVQEMGAIGDGTKSMIIFDLGRSNTNAVGFEIKKAFSLNDLSDKNYLNEDGGTCGELKEYEEYEAYIPERECLKHRDSAATLVEEMERLEDIESEEIQCQSLSTYSIKGFDEVDETSKSGDQTPLFYARPLVTDTSNDTTVMEVEDGFQHKTISTPMSEDDKLNVDSGLVMDKFNDSAITPVQNVSKNNDQVAQMPGDGRELVPITQSNSPVTLMENIPKSRNARIRGKSKKTLVDLASVIHKIRSEAAPRDSEMVVSESRGQELEVQELI